MSNRPYDRSYATVTQTTVAANLAQLETDLQLAISAEAAARQAALSARESAQQAADALQDAEAAVRKTKRFLIRNTFLLKRA